MTREVTTSFKENVGDCPCGCGAFGQLNPHTGHTLNCHDSCAHCASPRARARSRFGWSQAASRPGRIPTSVRRQVAARARGLCEARWSPKCMTGGVHAHHKRRRSQGGKNTAENLLWVCSPCHLLIHDQIDEAVKRGFLTHTEAP